MRKAKLTGLFCLLLLLIVPAACSFIYQLAQGLSVTGLREPVVWGVYVVNFTFCIGLTAGILIALSMISGLEIISASGKLFLSITALVGLAMSGAFIILDLGRIDRFYYLIIYPQPKSPLFWDFIITNFFAAFAIVFCFTSLRQLYLKVELDNNALLLEKLLYKVVTFKRNISIGKATKIAFRILTLFLVIGAYLLTTEVFSGLKAHPHWHSPLLNLSFLSLTILSGFSAFMLVRFFWRQPISQDNKKIQRFEGGIFLSLLAIDLVIMLVKYCADKNNPLIENMYSLFPSSLFVFLVLGNILPILLVLFFKTNKSALYLFAPIFVLVGVLLKRAELIIPPYFRRWLPFAPEASYYPTIHEISISIGIFGTALLILIIVFSFTKSIKKKYDLMEVSL